jgi:hypothetical protein
MHNNKSQKGNILFIILIAIGLFALLGSVVMDGESTTNKIGEDKAKIYAQDIISYANAMETAVQNMLARGVSETDLCFDFDVYPGGDDGYEHAACSDTKNRVFHPDGGGASYKIPPAIYFDQSYASDLRAGSYLFSASAEAYDVPLTTALTNTELLLYVFGLQKNICIQINNLLNIGLKNADPPIEQSSLAINNSSIRFTGSYTANSFDIGTPTTNEIKGKNAACVQSSNTGNFPDGYVAYFVLHAR